MTAARLWSGLALVATLALAGCQRFPEKPSPEYEGLRPEEVHDFQKLYTQNCSACHGADGQHGPAMALANPEYQAIVDDDTLRSVISNGETGTLMPAFAKSAGGMLTDEQVQILVSGMRSRWKTAAAPAGIPPYKTGKQGDPAHGAQAFTANCASCHTGAKAAGATKAGSVTDGSYLALISDQSLRAIIIAGRPDLGHPDWQNTAPGHPMSDQDVTDIVAWLASQRQKTPGQPYPSQK